MLAAASDADPSGITVGCPALPSKEAAAAVMAAISSGVMSGWQPCRNRTLKLLLRFYRPGCFAAIKIAGGAGKGFRRFCFAAWAWHLGPGS